LTPAATDVLKQVLGTPSRVVVNAALNAGTNPNLALEWFVDGTKSNQTGRVFEYTPGKVGKIVIEARVGSVVSNKIEIEVAPGSAGILSLGIKSTDVSFVNAKTLKIVGPGGGQVTVSGKTLAATSTYDLAGGFYNVILTEDFKVGDAATLTIKKDGYSDFVEPLLYDTRKLEVSAATYKDKTAGATGVTEIVKATDGAFVIQRPYILANTGSLNAVSLPVTVTFKSTDLNTTAGQLLTYKLERTSAPAGAPVYSNTTGQVEVSGGNAGGRSVTFNVTRETPLGDYVFKLVLGVKELTATIRIEDVKPEFKIKNRGTTTDVREVSFQSGLVSEATLANKVTTVAAVGGVYTIEKSYLENEFHQFTFTMTAENISVPANLVGTTTNPISTNPNQMLMSLAGPGGISFMRATSATQLQLTTPLTFRNNLGMSNSEPTVANRDGFVVSQKIDDTTAVGDYVFTVRILQLGTEIDSKTVTIRVSEPTAKLNVMGTVTDPDHLVWEEVLKGTLRDVDHDGGALYLSTATTLPAGVQGDYAILSTTGTLSLQKAEAFSAGPTGVSGTQNTDTLKLAEVTTTNTLARVNDLYFESDTFKVFRVTNVTTPTLAEFAPTLGFIPEVTEALLLAKNPADTKTFYDYESKLLWTYAAAGSGSWSSEPASDASNLIYASGLDSLTAAQKVAAITAGKGAAAAIGDKFLALNTGKLYVASNVTAASEAFTASPAQLTATIELGFGNLRVSTILRTTAKVAVGEAGIQLATSDQALTLQQFRWAPTATAGDYGAGKTYFDPINKVLYNNAAGTINAWATVAKADYDFEYLLTNNNKALFKFDNYSNSLVEVVNQPFFVDSFTTNIWQNVAATGWAAYNSGTVQKDTTLIRVADFVGKTGTSPSLATDEYGLNLTTKVLTRKTATGSTTITSIPEGALFAAVDSLPATTVTVYQYDSKDADKWVVYSSVRHVIIDEDVTDAGKNFELLTDSNNSKNGIFETVTTRNSATIAALLNSESLRLNSPVIKSKDGLAAGSLALLNTVANPTDKTIVAGANGIYLDEVLNSEGLAGKLMALKQTSRVINLVKTNGVYSVEKPLRDGMDNYVVNFNATLTNFQSLLAPQAGLDVSFTGTGGTRALVPFKKSFTSQMTLPNAASLQADTFIGVEVENATVGTGTRFFPATLGVDDEATIGVAGEISNRLSGDSRIFYDLYRSSGATTTLNNLFTLTLNRQTVNGAYTFNLQIGDLTETITVNVENAKPAIEVFAMDLVNNKVLAPTAGKYEVTLDALVNGEAKVAFSTNLINQRPAAASVNYDVTYTLTRNLIKWNEVKTDTVIGIDKVGNSGDLISTALNTVLNAENPTGADGSDTFLEITEAGEYKFKLEVGGASREFSVVVKTAPTASLVRATNGTGTTTITKGSTVLPVVDGYTQVPVGLPRVYFTLSGVNAPTAAKYMVTNQAFNLSKATGALRNALIALTATSTPVKSTERAISGGSGDVMVDANILDGSETGVANTLTTVGIKRFTVYLYNSNNDFLGYAEFAFEVVKPDPAILLAGGADADFFDTGTEGFTAATGADISGTVSTVVNYVTGYTSTAPFVITPATTLAGAGNSLQVIANQIIRVMLAASAAELPSSLKVSKFIEVVGTTKTEKPDLTALIENKEYEITLTATDLAGNTKTIFVTLKAA
jgi:hypothetical protein